jgi:RNA polymerase sigma factor (sigma-70 family)
MSEAHAYLLSTRPPSASQSLGLEGLMPPVDPLTLLSKRFADAAWEMPADGWTCGFVAECDVHGLCIERVVEVQTDETLALVVQKGLFVSPAFVELLVNRFGPKLPGWFVRHGRRFGYAVGEELVGELVQELWYRQFRTKFGGYDSTRSFGVFLFVVSRNLFVQRVVRARREITLAEWEEPGLVDTVSLEIEFREMSRRVATALPRLSPDYEEVLRLTLAGRTPEEIAGILKVPVKTVYRRLFHARRAVERDLSG